MTKTTRDALRAILVADTHSVLNRDDAMHFLDIADAAEEILSAHELCQLGSMHIAIRKLAKLLEKP